MQLSYLIFHTWNSAALNSSWACAQITQIALCLTSIFLRLICNFNTNLVLASKHENWCLLITAQIASQIGQSRSIRRYLLSNKRQGDINDTAKLPKVCLEFGHDNGRKSWRDTCWESTYTKQSFLLLQPYFFGLWAPHGKGSKRCTGVCGAVLPFPQHAQCHSSSWSAWHPTLPPSSFHLTECIFLTQTHLNSSERQTKLGPSEMRSACKSALLL